MIEKKDAPYDKLAAAPDSRDRFVYRKEEKSIEQATKAEHAQRRYEVSRPSGLLSC